MTNTREGDEIQSYIKIHVIYARSIRGQTDIRAGQTGRWGGGQAEGTEATVQSRARRKLMMWADGGRARAMKGEMQDNRRTRQGAE